MFTDEYEMAQQWSPSERLPVLMDAVEVVESAGYTVEQALPISEGWPVGEIVATAPANDGSTIAYRLHIDPDGKRWWHSVEDLHASTENYVAAPAGSAIPVAYSRWWLAERRRERERADEGMRTSLKEFLASA